MVEQLTLKQIKEIYDFNFHMFNGMSHEFYRDEELVFEAQVVGKNSEGKLLFETI